MEDEEKTLLKKSLISFIDNGWMEVRARANHDQKGEKRSGEQVQREEGQKDYRPGSVRRKEHREESRLAL